VGDHLVSAVKRTEGAPGFDVGQTLCDAGVNHAALRWRVLVVRGWEFGKDRDHPARHFEFEFLPTLKTGPPADGQWDHQRSVVFIFDAHGHDNNTAFLYISLSV
jgi:hypothetical protein